MFTRSVMRSPSQISLFALLLLFQFSTSSAARAQSADEAHIATRVPVDGVAPSLGAATRSQPMRVDVDLVMIPVIATDPMNRPVLSLQRDDFALYEGTSRQQIRYFSLEDAPLSIGLVLDCSASMKNKIEYERQALQEFFANANSQDEYFAVAVSDKPRVIATSADSLGTLQDRLISVPPQGHTALFDAIYLAVAKLRTARYQRRALLIISDGGDNKSRYTRGEIKKAIEEADVLTYAIGIFDEEPIPLLKSIEERMGREWLSELTDASGGRTIAADDRRKIPEIAGVVSRELRSQYVLGYRSSNHARDGKWRRVTVKVAQPAPAMRLNIHYKERYQVPAE